MLFKVCDSIVEEEASHVKGVRGRHFDQVKLEFLVKFLPKREVLVLRVCEELQGLADSKQSIPLQNFQKIIL